MRLISELRVAIFFSYWMSFSLLMRSMFLLMCYNFLNSVSRFSREMVLFWSWVVSFSFSDMSLVSSISVFLRI